MRTTKHTLKSLPQFFQPVWVGDKTFEIRLNDRDFQERDEVTLCEFDAEEGDYTGREIDGTIRYMTSFSQMPNYVVFAIEVSATRE